MPIASNAFRSVPAGRGLAWLSEGFGLFKQAPLMWIGLLLAWFIASTLASLIPFVGMVAINLTLPMVIGGLLLGAKAQRDGQTLKLDTLWAGFQPPHQQPLLLLGVLYLVLGMVIGVVVALVVAGLGFALLGGAFNAGVDGGLEVGLGAAIAMLIAFGLLLVFSLATWFAPALVVFRGLAPVDALKLSFRAALANVWPLSVYGLLLILMCAVALIPFGLGLLIALPVITISLYTSYADVFGGEQPLGLP